MNQSERNPNSVNQTGVNQIAIATPAVSLLGYWLAKKGIPPEALAPIAALAMALVTTLGTLIRNIAKEKGWTKYIG
jgi:hypothetical protein